MNRQRLSLRLDVWLTPIFLPLCRSAAAVYFRVRYTGEPVPKRGPVLLVANHQNALVDPALVVAASGRRVRFLAKSTLFTHKNVGFLVRGSGSIPVYRAVDDPTQLRRNLDAFRDVHRALAEGAAVGIFPEGLSHNEPKLARLKTGAARIALGAAERIGGAFPVIPIGLSFRQKDSFRSEALVLRGPSVVWDDLAARGLEDSAAMRELTARITDALRSVTVNLESWKDRPVVECAVRIWEAQRKAPLDPADRIARLEAAAGILKEVHANRNQAGLDLARDVDTHRRRLERLHLRPSDLTADVRVSRGIRWAVRRIHLVVPFGMAAGVVGGLLFWPPYWITGRIVRSIPLEEDVRSTWKLLVGMGTYIAWGLVVTAIVGFTLGPLAALATIALVPIVGMVGLKAREHGRLAWNDVRRFFLLRSRRQMVAALRERQRELGKRIDALFQSYSLWGPS